VGIYWLLRYVSENYFPQLGAQCHVTEGIPDPIAEAELLTLDGKTDTGSE
jgi:hypothetical protein